MANNELTVLSAVGAQKTLRSQDLGGGVQAQGVVLWEGSEQAPSLSGATLRHSIDDTTAEALVPPVAGASYARVRVFETSSATPDQTLRLYYRTDGTNPSSAGTNAMGYLLHGELIMVKLALLSNFRMIAESSAVFEVYVEWVTIPSS